MAIIGALQLGASKGGTAETLEHIVSFEADIEAQRLSLLVMPEALLGGYPKGEIFGTHLGYRLPEGRQRFAEYYDNAIEVPGKETKVLAELSRRTGCTMVIGVIEKHAGTLYCTALFFTPLDGLCAKHRKLMPTGTERLIWGRGDGSTLPVVGTAVGKVGAAICWENHMPLLRTAMYAKGVEIWCAPTVDERDIWQCSMRHVAHEGRCFVISACQYLGSPNSLGSEVPNWPGDRPLIRGGSVIIDPMGEVLAGPLFNESGLIVAEMDKKALTRAKYDFDVVGHYARPDVFSLRVDERSQSSVIFKK